MWTPSALPLPTILLSAKGQEDLRAIGLAGLCPPKTNICPQFGSCVRPLPGCASSLYITHQMWPSSALLREEEEEDRGWVVWYPELGCKARHPKTNLPLLTTGPKAGACGKWGWWIAVAWGRRAGCRGQGWFGTSLAGWRSLLCTTPSPRLFQPILFVRVSLYYISAYKSTLLWAGGGSVEDRCSSVNAVSILSPLGD